MKHNPKTRCQHKYPNSLQCTARARENDKLCPFHIRFKREMKDVVIAYYWRETVERLDSQRPN
jgi:hypothetical protein